MEVGEEKELIYGLMRKIIEERRELSKAYFDLKNQLESLHKQESESSDTKNNTNKKSIEISESLKFENKNQYGMPVITKRKKKNYPFERIAGYVIEMLKEEGIPLSNKAIHVRLQNNYEIYIGYSNLTNNILRKMINLDKYSIEKPTKGFYQYRKRGIEKHAR